MKFANIMFRTALTLVALTTALCVATTTLRDEAFASLSSESDKSSSPYAEWRVFLVGTNDYSGELPDTRFAENDVDEMRERLEELGVSRENMTVLKASNSEFYDSTSSGAIETRFEEYLDSLTEDSVAFVFFSGLGFEDNGPCYAPHDFRLDRFEETRLSFTDLARRLAESPAKFKLLCADTARLPLSEPSLEGAESEYEKSLERGDASALLDNASNLLVVMGCKANGNSFESPDLEHGLFTSVLLEALSGMGDANDDGVISMREFIEFLNKNVPKASMELCNKAQVPDFKLYTSGLTEVLELLEFPLFTVVTVSERINVVHNKFGLQEDEEAAEMEEGESDDEDEDTDEVFDRISDSPSR